MITLLCYYNNETKLSTYLVVEESLTDDQRSWFETDCCSFDEDDVPEIYDSEEECPTDDITGYVFGNHLREYHNGNYTRYKTFKEAQDFVNKNHHIIWG